ncbi:hypothetical protein [Pseudomonas sp.]|uniref:hypothetical protein n=1 Tax=Pseudomonas sp. TaxID=306 RepID=UPI003D6F8D7C
MPHFRMAIRATFGAVGPAVLLLGASCQAMAEVPLATSPSFKTTIQPMLDTYCVSCHIAGSAPENLDLQRAKAYAGLVDIPSRQSALKLVEPGSPEQSYLMHKVTGDQASVGGKGNAMPFGQTQAAPELINALKAWIEKGAVNN